MMSLAEDIPHLAIQRRTSLAEMSRAVPYRLPVYVGCTVLALITNYLLGKDMPWDTVNYHLYAGFSAVHDRFTQDYFAAGPQSYFNPYVYVPFYAMVSAGLSALEISSVLAAVHSIILWLTFELAICVCPSNDRRTRMIVGVGAVALAFVNPILLQQLGSSFADITTAIPVLAGWLLLARSVHEPRLARVLCAGFLLGAASAFKLTNSVHALAGFALMIVLPGELKGRVRHGLGYGFALGLGFVVVAAPWSYHLEQMFGNPLFPLMNGVFRSPAFTTEPLRHFRFIPESFVAALWRPFAMLDPVRMVHEELCAPDLRYALLLILFSLFPLRWLWRRLTGSSTSAPDGPTDAVRLLTALAFGLTTDWVLWLYGSGNSRYFLPMGCVAAVVIVGLLSRLSVTRPKVRNYVLAALVSVQATQLWAGTEYRWNAVPWSGKWLDVEAAEELRRPPTLYLTIGMQTNSFIAPFLGRGAGLVNFSGGYAPLAPQGVNGARMAALITRYAPHLRVLVPSANLYGSEALRSEIVIALQRFGLNVDTHDCSSIIVHGLPPELDATPARQASRVVEPQSRDTTNLVSCHLGTDGTADSARYASDLQTADLVLDRLEDACPELFQPRRPLTEPGAAGWVRRYANTDLTAWVSSGRVKFTQLVGEDRVVSVGLEIDWARAPLRLVCGRRDNEYFAKVLPSEEGPWR